jgi:hypothetical protein
MYFEKPRILQDNIGKRYIGSSENLERRFREYFNTKYLMRNESMTICRAFIKHGYQNFSLEIIEYCKIEDLLIKEKYYIYFFGSEYNTVKDPTLPPMSGRTHSNETRQKMSDSKKGEKNPCFGRTGEDHPMFAQAKAEGSGSPKQKISVFDNKNNQTTDYDSISAAAIALDIKQSTISSYFARNQKKLYKGRYVFKKVN